MRNEKRAGQQWYQIGFNNPWKLYIQRGARKLNQLLTFLPLLI